MRKEGGGAEGKGMAGEEGEERGKGGRGNREREKRRGGRPGESVEQGVRRQNGAARRVIGQAPMPVWSVSRDWRRQRLPRSRWEGSEVRGQLRVGSCWGSMVEGLASVSKWSDTSLSRTAWSLMAK